MKQAELNKLIDQIAKSIARSRGWKFSRGFIFRKIDNLFFCLLITGHAKSRNLHHLYFYKWLDFDDLFWKIVELPENADEPLSFRASGAWTAPMIDVESAGKVLEELTEKQLAAEITTLFDDFEQLVKSMTRQITTLDENLEFLTNIQKGHLEKHPGSARTIHVQEMLTAIPKRRSPNRTFYCRREDIERRWRRFRLAWQ